MAGACTSTQMDDLGNRSLSFGVLTQQTHANTVNRVVVMRYVTYSGMIHQSFCTYGRVGPQPGPSQ